MANNDVYVGPWGRGDGTPWTFKPEGRITKIHISGGGCIDSIKFTYMGQDGITHESETYGGGTGNPNTITFANNEVITGIRGTYGVFRDVSGDFLVITSLSFQTNQATYGPFGTATETNFTLPGSSFSLPVTTGRFVGFNGKYEKFLSSFGAILAPN